MKRLDKASQSEVVRSALESLAIIAYKQPIVRSEIEEIRGVETSGVVRTLLERKLVRIVGRKEVPGRPIMYGTTKFFLEHFGLQRSLTAAAAQRIQRAGRVGAVPPAHGSDGPDERCRADARTEAAVEAAIRIRVGRSRVERQTGEVFSRSARRTRGHRRQD